MAYEGYANQQLFDHPGLALSPQYQSRPVQNQPINNLSYSVNAPTGPHNELEITISKILDTLGIKPPSGGPNPSPTILTLAGQNQNQGSFSTVLPPDGQNQGQGSSNHHFDEDHHEIQSYPITIIVSRGAHRFPNNLTTGAALNFVGASYYTNPSAIMCGDATSGGQKQWQGIYFKNGQYSICNRKYPDRFVNCRFGEDFSFDLNGGSLVFWNCYINLDRLCRPFISQSSDSTVTIRQSSLKVNGTGDSKSLSLIKFQGCGRSNNVIDGCDIEVGIVLAS